MEKKFIDLNQTVLDIEVRKSCVHCGDYFYTKYTYNKFCSYTCENDHKLIMESK